MKLELGDFGTRIRHTYFRKPMASEQVTWSRSALSARAKRDILINDLCRRLRNCDRWTDRETKEYIISDYCRSLRMGEHKEEFRELVCMRAMRSNMKSWENDRNGIKKIYRNRREVEERWEAEGGRPDKASWFRKGGTTGVLMVPSSARGRIKEKVEKILERMPGPKGQKMKVLEEPGPSIRQSVIKSDPNPNQVCGRSLCPLGRDDKCHNKCYKEGVQYTIVCRRCNDSGDPPKIYIGETHRSVYTRFNGHLVDLKTAMKHPSKGTGSLGRHMGGPTQWRTPPRTG